ncbi:hypothetical protein AVEN_132227-1 [Araneus ventricosus]|uniref:Helitron helicase-like domain-containing protein n=1 Tax=Araneus ventricosus TaxID=182803 RepID=A0A4Y2IK23_ARAVE|nr:hypothetical protein AVEN_132227-1 [Araneus ventricosus]
MSYQDWVKSKIMRDDRRCAKIADLFFSALKLRNSKLSSSISFCLRKSKSKKKLNAQDALNEANLKELEMHDSGFRAFTAGRGAPAFWELEEKEFFAMLNQIGPHTFFLPMSPAEMRWLESIVILKKVVDGEIIAEENANSISYSERVSLVK